MAVQGKAFKSYLRLNMFIEMNATHTYTQDWDYDWLPISRRSLPCSTGNL